jgi:hypothetical protein
MMTIEVSIENDKWLRADLVENEQRVKNLYHAALKPNEGQISQFNFAAYYVKNNFPQYSQLKIVSIIGAGSVVGSYSL